MAYEIVMPAIESGQETGVLIRWLKSPGDRVAKGEPLMEIETAKAQVEIEAPASGVLASVRAKAGDCVPIGQVMGLLLSDAEHSAQA
jgi:pyruvate dehydrogenase E2 component (dihydrolipoamide acetyltransferase)